jgi:hypothetical protein
MRNIKEGDLVMVLVSDEESELWRLTHGNAKLHFQRIWFEVLHTPADTGDLWHLRSANGKVEIAVNPCSSNFDGFFKARDTGGTES